MSTPVLLLSFVVAAGVTWVAGVKLAQATDIIDDHFGLGEALGGMILLSVAGSLPELAITVSAAVGDNLGMAAGNLIGGVAMQTFVLVVADRSMRGQEPLSTAARSLVPALEGMLVIAVVAVTGASGLLPSSAAIGPVGIGAICIVVIWILGMRILSATRDRTDLGLPVRAGAATSIHDTPDTSEDATTTADASRAARNAIIVFGVGAVITLIGGVVLERVGNELADDWGISGVLFGATVLAFTTALPEISSGISGVRMQRYTLVFGDIFGGNAFQLTLFIIADLVAGQPVLPSEGRANAFIAMVGLVMTAVYVAGIILRPTRRHLGLGPDSWTVAAVYAIGLWGFVVVSS